MDESKFLKVAKNAATEAGKIILSLSGQNLQALKETGKEATNLVTEADLKSEERIIEMITDAFPDHNIISEERGRIDKGSEYTWVIDPLDSTINFMAGLPFFAVSIGLLKDNQPLLGVINLPAREELYWAEVGKGAYLNGHKIHVSAANKLKDAVIGIDVGYENRTVDLDKYFYPLVDQVRYPLMLGGSAASAALVAKGILDSFLHKALVWDWAAGVPIVIEAGGKATDKNGDNIDWSQQWMEVIVSNGLVHPQILEALK